MQSIKELRILSVVSAVSYFDAEELFKPYKEYKIKQLHIDVNDNATENVSRYFNNVYKFVDNALKEGNVLIHCYGGVSRSSSFVLSYLMKSQNIDYKTAYKILKERRPGVHPNENFRNQLLQFERSLGIKK